MARRIAPTICVESFRFVLAIFAPLRFHIVLLAGSCRCNFIIV